MRHRKSFNHLGRTSAHRTKALKMYVEPLISKAKEDTTHSRRVVFSYLENKEAVAELYRDVAVKVADRPGGYTRILRTATRLGDNADMCIIELVDYNEAMLEAKDSKKKASRRSRGAKTAKVADKPKAAAEIVKEEAPVVEVVEETPVATIDADVAEQTQPEEIKGEEEKAE
jgi:large subunit ribosomal protein L17